MSAKQCRPWSGTVCLGLSVRILWVNTLFNKHFRREDAHQGEITLSWKHSPYSYGNLSGEENRFRWYRKLFLKRGKNQLPEYPPPPPPPPPPWEKRTFRSGLSSLAVYLYPLRERPFVFYWWWWWGFFFFFGGGGGGGGRKIVLKNFQDPLLTPKNGRLASLKKQMK